MSSTIKMKGRDWKILVNNIISGNCILVIGPDMASVEIEGKSKPITSHFANHLVGEIDGNPKIGNEDDLEEVIEAFLHQEPEDALQFEADEFFRENCDERPVYDDLAAIPFNLIINASPDKSLIRAFERKDLKIDKDFYVDFYNHKGRKRDQARWEDEKKPMLFYLYGSSDNWDSVVVSEIHLLDYLLSIISQTPALQSNISSRFCDEKTSFVFLGFGFQNWYLRILLYTLLGGKEVQKGRSRRSVALEKMMTDDKSDSDRITVLFKNKLNIIYPERKLDEFISELRKLCENKLKGKEEETGIRPDHEDDEIDIPGAPSVFICHASEDKKEAMDIYRSLKKGQLNPWIDKEGIRSGDNWNLVLERTIKDIDYFIVVQSKAMAGKVRGYVNKEINLALRLADEVRAGFNYLFPVLIDDSEPLEELRKYQTRDLTDISNIKGLIKDIRRDWERLKR
ncbi:toll/interleukin-1 receptor domain-containing protein [Poritiphilus flavus]|uniref:TIR domain-containing protein n=1 Tax=Poritiphilus flavus TaxID=2697053 RepID=A0A6L9EJG2_9FLAO|nr:toll/interleukin-1 receptor domain-containing protein [Poritiphilus flavus]NAS14319.1 TIR domain-containing protein [Poritiphilus flavus]